MRLDHLNPNPERQFNPRSMSRFNLSPDEVTNLDLTLSIGHDRLVSEPVLAQLELRFCCTHTHTHTHTDEGSILTVFPITCFPPPPPIDMECVSAQIHGGSWHFWTRWHSLTCFRVQLDPPPRLLFDPLINAVLA